MAASEPEPGPSSASSDASEDQEPALQEHKAEGTLRHGAKPGDVYVRLMRHKGFRRLGPGRYEIRLGATDPKTGLPRLWSRAKRLLIGEPLATAAAGHERLTKVKALAVLSSDALSSVAYATEEILKILLLAGSVALWVSLPIAAVIVALLAVVG